MPVNDRRKAQLRLIIDDPASTEQERYEATRALQELSSDQPQSPRRPGRNSNIPPTQDDQDDDLLAALNFRRTDGFTASDYCDLCRSFDQLTNDCIDAIGNTQLLWIWKPNDAQLMIDLHAPTNRRKLDPNAML